MVGSGDEGPTGAMGPAPKAPSPFLERSLGPLAEVGIAVGLVAMATGVRWGLGFVFPGLGLFALYFPAVLLAALIGGWRSGLAAVGLAGLIIVMLFVSPLPSGRMSDPTSPGNLLIVALATAPLVFFGDYVRRLLKRVRRSRDALAERNLHFDALFASMLEGYALCEAIRSSDGRLIDYTIVEMNPALMRQLRVGPEAIGTRLSDSEGDRTAWLKLCERVLRTGEPAGFEREEPQIGRWFEIRVTRVTEDLMAQVFFDITDRKTAQIRQAGLFDELNHRVSNSLALVSAILRMKARATDHELVRDQLLRAEARVHSIAQVHRALYRGGQTDQVAFGAYLRDLCDSLRESQEQDGRIAFEIDVEEVMVPIDTTIPLGMVVNELVTNAIKYAYPSPARGVISVGLERLGKDLRLTVADDGRGLGPEAETPSSGLGMRLVRSLVAQVGGELVVGPPPGARFEVTVPARSL